MSSREVSRWNWSGAKAASTDPLRRQIEQLHSIASVGSASRLYAILPQWQLPRIGMTRSFIDPRAKSESDRGALGRRPGAGSDIAWFDLLRVCLDQSAARYSAKRSMQLVQPP